MKGKANFLARLLLFLIIFSEIRMCMKIRSLFITFLWNHIINNQIICSLKKVKYAKCFSCSRSNFVRLYGYKILKMVYITNVGRLKIYWNDKQSKRLASNITRFHTTFMCTFMHGLLWKQGISNKYAIRVANW